MDDSSLSWGKFFNFPNSFLNRKIGFVLITVRRFAPYEFIRCHTKGKGEAGNHLRVRAKPAFFIVRDENTHYPYLFGESFLAVPSLLTKSGENRGMSVTYLHLSDSPIF